MRNPILKLVLLLLLASVAAAQSKGYWEKKDYRQWTEKECRKLLEDSPWANLYSLSQVFIDTIQTDSTSRERQPNPSIEYRVQIRSATPVRQALVRLSQINAKYDAMTPDARQAFDQSTEKFLAAGNSNLIVMHVSYTASVQNDDRELARYWHSRTTETLKNFVFLIGGGGVKVPLSSYRPGESAARELQFVFPRDYNGRPVIGSGDKTLMLEFDHPNIRGTGTRVLVEFKIEKMMIQGSPVY
jgi:hypothetical protein